ncbi:hypothetical protein BC826DRAFT_497324 [Russula brevipes]|nr:hypothetical protein BC826DRAFT_497324 [Russula brevipes]
MVTNDNGGRRTPDHALLRCTRTIRLEAFAYSKRNVTSNFSFLFVESRPALHNLDRTGSSYPWPHAEVIVPHRSLRAPHEPSLAWSTVPVRAGIFGDHVISCSHADTSAAVRRGDPSAEYVCTRSLRRNNSKHPQLLNVFPSALLPTGQCYHSPVLNSSCTYLTLVQRQTFTQRSAVPLGKSDGQTFI